MPSRQPRRRLLGALAVPLALLAATACSTANSAGPGGSSDGATRTFKADNGKVEIPEKPERVVATGYAVPALIEADASLVGISGFRRSLPMMSAQDRKTYDGLKKIAGETAAETNYEAIASVKPDLIVVGVPAPVLGELDMERLESIAPVVAVGPTLPNAWRKQSERQSDAVGRTENFAGNRTAYEKQAARLAEKYEKALDGKDFGHLGAYAEGGKGTFQREFAGSWGTNIAEDVGVHYYGEVRKKLGGSRDTSEYPAIEELTASFEDADAITYTVDQHGRPAKSVEYVLKSTLWKNLPAVKAGEVYPLRHTEATTYTQARKTLDAIDKAFAPLLED
ncbi:ABC transporter substrate-binding protein [Streptomyces sp. XM4193]|uniref:ABC transporter substrate-binding protein n=1 Tax=Streptomyces sp. XM4193 TaxID=2929782 RepID=UPI001FFA504A|nr:ABC transporter substrate-binding protein [Streptomyces sp. XM4193]MCK1794863.1 ABC transporter substrate-binding protein [Streptomyces sp. XM4193]